mgnify:CR=1 FL=1
MRVLCILGLIGQRLQVWHEQGTLGAQKDWRARHGSDKAPDTKCFCHTWR